MTTAAAALATLLGPVRQDPANSVFYRASQPVTTTAVRDLARSDWCRSMYVSDSGPHGPSFTALCRINGADLTVTGQVAE